MRSEKGKRLACIQAALEGAHMGLGEMIAEIDATRRLPEPAYPELMAWLQRKVPRLAWGFFRKQS